MFFRDLGPHSVLYTVYDVHDLYIRRIKLWCLKWVILKPFMLGKDVDFYWLH